MIKAPKWCSDAVPVASKGWVSPKGELMASSRFTQAQVDEWYGTEVSIETTAEEDIQEAIMDMNARGKIQAEMARFAAVSKDAMSYDHTDEEDLQAMTKLELELLGREHGVELDRRKSKATLIEQMKDLMSK
tara:strand:+ start:776 stop:1171 length:396 start_codon:yes stop_codon:yes gene_type:complete